MQTLTRPALEQVQFAALQRLLTDVLPENSFYRWTIEIYFDRSLLVLKLQTSTIARPLLNCH